ncbi:HNH endonuclease [Paucibacter sp. hw8]|uniref:HNH endonuclease n=1 Tax=Roseateles albus TaxID=2987525 RepID=A0ABT5KD86_9BURK|nr:HNH endonuclease [Roseateles albus]
MTQCVYTIVNRPLLEAAIESGGEGVFTEGRPWASAHRHLASLELSEPFPLLIGDAATTAGVEWVAMIETIELVEGGSTHVHFSSLVKLGEAIPITALRKTSDGLPISENYIRPYVPCTISGEFERVVLTALAGTDEDPYAAIDSKTAEDFAEALRAIGPKITTAQKAMLIGHAKATLHALSMLSLAELGGYAKFQSANMQYGALGRKFSDHFDIHGLNQQTQAIAKLGKPERDELGHWVWVLRAPLVEALYLVGWVPRPAYGCYLANAAAIEVADDPQCADVTATVRQALVDARIGQGAYRSKLLEVWRGRCSLTGCSIAQVLIASHAKPWSQCDNRERLDEFNGLLLAAHVDKLFDAGLIAFADNGHMLTKECVDAEAFAVLGIPTNAKLRFVQPQHIPYLKAHRMLYGFEP